MSATVVIRPLAGGTDAASILDALDIALGAPGDRLGNGRRYSIEGVADRAAAVAHLELQLDRISATWPAHVAIHGIA
jgi:hypothetical protein